MARKAILVGDPGIDTACAIALALHDPDIDVVALCATAGNVSAQQATRNVHALVEYFDPPKWPRIGGALPIDYDVNFAKLHGPDGLGGISLPCSELHHSHPADKLIHDEVKNAPGELTIVMMGPLTALARAIDRNNELPRNVRQLIILGGSMHEPGNVSPVAEFRFYCDPLAARIALRCGAPITLIPLDVMRKALFSPTELAELPCGESRTCQLLRKMFPHGIGASANQYGIEGFYLQDVLGVVALALPGAFKLKPMTVDVETQGELTRGMSVFDLRRQGKAAANVDLAVDVDLKLVKGYMESVFRRVGTE